MNIVKYYAILVHTWVIWKSEVKWLQLVLPLEQILKEEYKCVSIPSPELFVCNGFADSRFMTLILPKLK